MREAYTKELYFANMQMVLRWQEEMKQASRVPGCGS